MGGATIPSMNRMAPAYSVASDSLTSLMCSRILGAASCTSCESTSPMTPIV